MRFFEHQHPEIQYLRNFEYIFRHGHDMYNERTGFNVRSVPNLIQNYQVGDGPCPILTSREMGIKSSLGEFIGYLQGVTSAADMRRIGTNTWNANANVTKGWLNNPHRKGKDDMGEVYGAVGRRWPDGNGGSIDQLEEIYQKLLNRNYDRGLVYTMWDPARLNKGCIRPCLFLYTFELMGDTLHMTAYQRSADFPLGVPANMVQCYFFLKLMAQITNLKAGDVMHVMCDAHIYENQFESTREHLERHPVSCNPVLTISDEIRTLQDVTEKLTLDHITLSDYESKSRIVYPFAP